MAKILIVEDELLIAADIQRALIRLGHSPLEPVDNSEEALETLSENSVELVLMDININGEMDGIATALQVRRQFNIPVIFLTARTDTPTLNRAKVAQPYGYIPKPYTDDMLKVQVELAIYNAYQLPATRPAPSLTVAELSPEVPAPARSEKVDDFLFVRKGARWVKVQYADILFFESKQNYVQLHTATDQLVFDSTLKELELSLPNTFLKTHRSYIVNLGHVIAYEDGYVEIGKEQFLPVSRTFMPDLKNRLHLLG
ncbi:LytTR family transcriptional regulator DNA-binding domain-containing protein [Hymenobacter sp. DG01]|uniref:LytTR family transcriptional regulator DNA-binding domain-containing protein n=1 Tax=Hymenobacter sp. DG01 TaxID=2584940 RepID=UPI00111E6A43|nr:LytTR family transcriptional regulator DNA-binding domain-containing protein [Hymenobacter sp. DG01]